MIKNLNFYLAEINLFKDLLKNLNINFYCLKKAKMNKN